VIFSEYARQWMETVVPLMKPASQVAVKSHLSKLVATFGARSLDLSHAEVQGFFTSLAQVQAPKTVRNLWATLHNMLSAAVQEGLIAKIPQIKLPKAVRVEQDWLSVDNMRRIIADSRPKYRPLYGLLAETGLRIGEALALRFENLDTTEGVLRVRESIYNGRIQLPKTPASIRTLTLSKHVADLVGPPGPPDAFVFSTFGVNPWWPDKVLKDLHQLMSDLTLPQMGFHSLRRGNATLMCSELGVPTKIAAYRLGHQAEGLTLGLYSQSWAGMDKEWAPKIGRALFT
jgi:integrase